MAKVVTIFRNRLKPGNVEEYYQWAGRISALAKTMPGHLSHKTFTAEDGERVTVVEFADEASHRAWAMQAQHVEAKKKGRESFYAEYSIQVCSVTRESRFSAQASPPVAALDRT